MHISNKKQKNQFSFSSVWTVYHFQFFHAAINNSVNFFSFRQPDGHLLTSITKAACHPSPLENPGSSLSTSPWSVSEDNRSPSKGGLTLSPPILEN